MPREKEKEVSSFKRIISAKGSFYFLILLLLLALFYLVKEIRYRQLLVEELNYVKEQVQEEETEKQNLIEDLEKIKSDYFKEKAARLNLGLQMPGEKAVVVIPPEDYQAEEKDITSSSEGSWNLKSWWDYFFKRSNH
ncbi:septum formation initiator family protein [Patescibacteria group bacterium]|nr:septum formation initiator family protein [Patescibacteria group bacterium]